MANTKKPHSIINREKIEQILFFVEKDLAEHYQDRSFAQVNTIQVKVRNITKQLFDILIEHLTLRHCA